MCVHTVQFPIPNLCIFFLQILMILIMFSVMSFRNIYLYHASWLRFTCNRHLHLMLDLVNRNNTFRLSTFCVELLEVCWHFFLPISKTEIHENNFLHSQRLHYVYEQFSFCLRNSSILNRFNSVSEISSALPF
jgi:hypothetical protein